MINQAVSHGAGSGPALPWGWMRNPRAGSESHGVHGGVLWHTRVQKWGTLAHMFACTAILLAHCEHARCLTEHAFACMVHSGTRCAQARVCVCHLAAFSISYPTARI